MLLPLLELFIVFIFIIAEIASVVAFFLLIALVISELEASRLLFALPLRLLSLFLVAMFLLECCEVKMILLISAKGMRLLLGVIGKHSHGCGDRPDSDRLDQQQR